MRFTSRVLRQLKGLRKRLTVEALITAITHYFPHDSAALLELQQLLIKARDTMDTSDKKETVSHKHSSPEVQVYLHLLVVIFLIDKKHYQEASVAASSLVKILHTYNRRTLLPLAAKAYFYFSRAYELLHRSNEIRSTLIALHRSATLRHDDEGQATLLNLLLRNYLEYNLYGQADKLLSNTSIREEAVSNNQFARFLYYQGRVKAIQLEYIEAGRCLLLAVRKAPQYSAKGFRITAQKLACIVQLLMGEIPERSTFRQPGLKAYLKPYYELTQAVNFGHLSAFQNVVKQYSEVFKKDKTFTLIQRLRVNVIKTGLRKINLSYSRISLEDVRAKLHLDSVEDTEFIVAKAIRDRVIDATINHEARYLQSNENIDIYSSSEPTDAFNKRIVFCLNTHNEAVRAMRFPPDASKPDYSTDEARRERQKQEQEIANTLAKEEEDY